MPRSGRPKAQGTCFRGDPALPSDASPLAPGEARLLFAPFNGARAVLLAVSGGPDSMALMHLAGAAARADPSLPPLAIATVDHGLRAGSRAEAEAVADAARALGLSHHLLTWEGEKPAARLQERARERRYALLDGCARRIGATHLATAHTLDDQAETVLFRLMRGSGPAGLAGMAPSVIRGAVVHLRPFLGLAKARLVASCRAGGWSFAEDPSNADPRFARTRLRALMPVLAREGLDAPRLAALARRMAEAEAALAAAAALTLAEARRENGGYSAARWRAEPAAVRHRALGLMLRDALPEAPPPRLDRLEHLSRDLQAAAEAGAPLRRTLGGALVELDGSETVVVTAAPPRRRGPGAA